MSAIGGYLELWGDTLHLVVWPPSLGGGGTGKDIQRDQKGQLNFADAPWPKISNPAKDCVRRMLEMNPRKRATANQILRHEWLKENGVASTEPIGNAVMDRIKGFSSMNQMKKVSLQVSRLPAICPHKT